MGMLAAPGAHLGAVVVLAGALTGVVLSATGAGGVPPPERVGDPDTGAEIWLQDCAVCHGVEGEGSFRGPAIDDEGTAAVDFMVRTGRMPINEPASNIARDDPSYSEQEIQSLVAYTARFIEGPEAVAEVDVATADVSLGGEIWRLECAPCHQSVGQGGALAYGTVAPPVVESTPVEVVEALRTGPGTMPVFGPDVFDEETAAAIAAYVELLGHPEDPGGLGLWHLGPVPEGLVAWVVGLGGAVLVARWLGQRQKLDTD